MIPSKDAKELLYKLFAERFIALQVISDTCWLGLAHLSFRLSLIFPMLGTVPPTKMCVF